MKALDKLKSLFPKKNDKPKTPQKGNPLPPEKLDTGRSIAHAKSKDPGVMDLWRKKLEEQGIKPADRILEIAKAELEGNPSITPNVMQQAPLQFSQMDRYQKLQELDQSVLLANRFTQEKINDYQLVCSLLNAIINEKMQMAGIKQQQEMMRDIRNRIEVPKPK